MMVFRDELLKDEVIRKSCLEEECPALKSYFKESNLRIDLERQNEKLKEENALYRAAIASLLEALKEALHPRSPIINFLKEQLNKIPQVTQAHYFVTDNVVNIWIEIEKDDYEIEMRVIKTLHELYRIFRNLLFDFMIVPRNDVSLREMLPEDHRTIFIRS